MERALSVFYMIYIAGMVTAGFIVMSHRSSVVHRLFGGIALALGLGWAFTVGVAGWTSSSGTAVNPIIPAIGNTLVALSSIVCLVVLYYIALHRYGLKHRWLTVLVYLAAAVGGLLLLLSYLVSREAAPWLASVSVDLVLLIDFILYLLHAKQDRPLRFMPIALALCSTFSLTPLTGWHLSLLFQMLSFLWVVIMGLKATQIPDDGKKEERPED